MHLLKKKIQNYSADNDTKEFAILCLNNARFQIGDSEGLPDEEKCLDSYKKENFKLQKTTKIPDFIIYFVSYDK